jgi:hypothetical protein
MRHMQTCSSHAARGLSGIADSVTPTWRPNSYQSRQAHPRTVLSRMQNPQWAVGGETVVGCALLIFINRCVERNRERAWVCLLLVRE